MLSFIIDEKDVSDNVYRLEKEILEHNKPNSWNVYDENNLERSVEVDFAKYGIAVAKRAGIKLDTTTVFMFYSAVEQIENETKPKQNG